MSRGQLVNSGERRWLGSSATQRLPRASKRIGSESLLLASQRLVEVQQDQRHPGQRGMFNGVESGIAG